MKDPRELVEEALFEARPYVEYSDRLRSVILSALKETGDVEELKARIESLMEKESEPFKTDLRIFLQKLEGLLG
ncbi:hypothetical protein A3L09_03700 [Thermococcus profundus]|uniref:Uncharacterized protein n=1 Tax=Thermococcus profundus TaxID=49899 RepID=A0A2Z2MAG3_THEPR|nr:hypothetical protein [Thermococcus profundus]ASJ02419.1 hypothetical protein A3L09_03700 [Thermococcus profundus]